MLHAQMQCPQQTPFQQVIAVKYSSANLPILCILCFNARFAPYTLLFGPTLAAHPSIFHPHIQKRCVGESTYFAKSSDILRIRGIYFVLVKSQLFEKLACCDQLIL